MGHKVHPIGFRLGVVKGWQSRWYAERDYKDLLAEDFMLRKQIRKELANASISRIEIERAAANQVSVTIHTAKPGIVIGKSGEKVDRLRASLEAKTKKRVRLNIVEIRQPELDAYPSWTQYCGAIGEACLFPPCYEAGSAENDARKCKGHTSHCGWTTGWS